jgi:hypothetical protein
MRLLIGEADTRELYSPEADFLEQNGLISECDDPSCDCGSYHTEDYDGVLEVLARFAWDNDDGTSAIDREESTEEEVLGEESSPR